MSKKRYTQSNEKPAIYSKKVYAKNDAQSLYSKLIKENTIFSENFSEYKWSIQNSPVSQNYNSYFCRLFLKKDVKIDMSVMSEKL